MKTSLGFAACLALLAGGCQLLAGVRTDGELLTGGTAGSGGGQNTGGTGGTTSSTGGCSGPADCPGGACLAGECVTPTCQLSGSPVDLFTTDELSGNTFDPNDLLLVVDGDRAHLVVADDDQPRLLLRTWTSSQAAPTTDIVEVDLTGFGGTEFTHARIENDQLYLSGRRGEEVGRLVLSVANSTVQTGSTFEAFPALPAQCMQPAAPTRILLDHVDGSTRYALTCQSASGRTLLVGSDAAPPEIVQEGAAGDEKLEIRSYLARPDGTQLVISGGSDGADTWFRQGATIAQLQPVQKLAFSGEPNVITFVGDALHAPGGTAFLGATLSTVDSSGALWAGVVDDLAALENVPPTGLAAVLPFEMPISNGFSRTAGDASGYYAAGPSLDGKSLLMFWIDPGLKVALLPGTKVLELPGGDTGEIIGAVLGRSLMSLMVAWTELQDSKLSIRGARFVCSY